MLNDATLPIEAVMLHPDLRMRETDREYVAVLAALHTENAGAWPKPGVVSVKGIYYLVDGFQRFDSYTLRDYTSADVRVVETDVTWERALYLAATANRGCGRPLDQSSFGKAIRTVARVHPEWTQELVALRVGCTQGMVSHVLVGRRCAPENNTSIDDGGPAPAPRPRPSPKHDATAKVWEAHPEASAAEIAKLAGVGTATAERSKPEELKKRPRAKTPPAVAAVGAFEYVVEGFERIERQLGRLTYEERAQARDRAQRLIAALDQIQHPRSNVVSIRKVS